MSRISRKFKEWMQASNRHCFRGFVAILFVVFLQITTLFPICSEFMGGSRGPVINDVYHLDRHGELTAVTYEVWFLIRYIGIASFCGFCLTMLCMFIMMIAISNQSPWYMKGNDYSWMVPVVVIFDFIFVLAASCLRGFNNLGN